MKEWRSRVRLKDPCWADFADLLDFLPEEEFPSPERLSSLLSQGARNRSGRAIRFVAAETIPGVSYEAHIHATGEVSTRRESWHDLFNALVWARYPKLKSAMNACHQVAMGEATGHGRGARRDALTLFDECGVIVTARRAGDLECFARREWPTVFSSWPRRFGIFVIGHAMLEKFLAPYKAMTANALLLQVAGPFQDLDRAQQREMLDEWLAGRLLGGDLFGSPADLSPLPLAGIPGWWPRGQQDADFYADPKVFRAPPDGHRPPPVFPLG